MSKRRVSALILVIVVIGVLIAVGDLWPQPSAQSVRGPQSSRRNRNCGTLAQRLECVEHTHPVFTSDDCSVPWDCDPLVKPKFPFQCCVTPLSRMESLRLLNGSWVQFFGDSTARRAARQLTAFLSGSDFSDEAYHFSHTQAVTSFRSNISVTSHWFPLVNDLILELETGTRWPTHPVTSPHLTSRTVNILAYSTHDLRGMWSVIGAEHADAILHSEDSLNAIARRIADAVSLFKQHPDLDLVNDILLLRLPIAQGCEPTKSEYTNWCWPAARLDPVNLSVEKLHHRLLDAMHKEHPEVGLLDLLSWTWAPDKYDRAKCTPADDGGTHFATDTARMAYVQQVLHAIQLLSVDKPAWRGHTFPDCLPA